MTLFQQILKALAEAKERPSKHCVNGLSHTYFKYSYENCKSGTVWYLKCENCKEVIKTTNLELVSSLRTWGEKNDEQQ